jgi:phosphate transport system substrate-binding protein
MAPLVVDIGQRFQERRPDVRINVQSAPESRAVSDAMQGLADLGMLGRSLRTPEIGLLDFPIARDGLAVIVHKNNPVQSLSDGQIVGLFTGTYTNWKDLGGPDRPVALAGQMDGRAARTAFLAYFGLRPQQVRADPTVPGGEQAVQAVAAHPYAIGYASLGEAEAAARTLPIRLLPLGGVAATLDNVRNGRYPLVRPLLLLSRTPPEGAERDFIDFARSAEVHDLIGKYGFVPAATPNPKAGAGAPQGNSSR